jgi:hypothetical protein
MSKGFHRRVFDMDRNRGHSPLYPYTVGQYGSGANMAMRKGMMGDLWQFDNTLGTGTLARGGEDLDCYLDVLLRGHSIVYEPRALVRHGHRSDHAALRVQMRHYGVGLSALITKRLLAAPGARTDLLKRIPHGVRFALSSESRQGARGHEGYPRDLLIQEWIGIAEGPFAYVRSRLRKAWLTS